MIIEHFFQMYVTIKIIIYEWYVISFYLNKSWNITYLCAPLLGLITNIKPYLLTNTFY